jgi:hypothetical protein
LGWDGADALGAEFVEQMVIAQVKGIYTMEMEDLESYRPNDFEKFRVDVRVLVGPKGKTSADTFDFHVATPKWLAERCEKDGFVNGIHTLIVSSYDAKFIKQLLGRFIERCAGSSWAEVAAKVGRLGHWEFQDLKTKSSND